MIYCMNYTVQIFLLYFEFYLKQMIHFFFCFDFLNQYMVTLDLSPILNPLSPSCQSYYVIGQLFSFQLRFLGPQI
jgi:hypothetical protein